MCTVHSPIYPIQLDPIGDGHEHVNTEKVPVLWLDDERVAGPYYACHHQRARLLLAQLLRGAEEVSEGGNH